jgi:hypothetical protein
MTLKGIARGNAVELQDPIDLPEGTEVEIVIHAAPQPAGRYRKGSAQAILAAVAEVESKPEDVRELLRLIRESRQPADFRPIFEEEPSE